MRAFSLRLSFRQRLRLVGRVSGTQTILCELIRGRESTQVDFGRVLFRCAQEEITSGKVSMNLGRGVICLGRGRRGGRRVL